MPGSTKEVSCLVPQATPDMHDMIDDSRLEFVLRPTSADLLSSGSSYANQYPRAGRSYCKPRWCQVRQAFS